MRRSSAVALVVALAACSSESNSRSTDTASAVGVANDSGAERAATSLSDTLAVLAPAPRAPRVLLVDSTAKADNAVGSNEPATPFCAPGLKDSAGTARFVVVRAVQHTFKPTGSRDSTTWGRADYRPNDPARFGMTATQVLRVDCATRRVLGLGPDITALIP